MNPKGNHPAFPTLPDGKRDIDHSWKLADTWKQMEALLKAGGRLLVHVSIGSAARRLTSDLTSTNAYTIIFSVLGKVKSIGVSNFSEAKLEEILPSAEVIPAVNQVSENWNTGALLVPCGSSLVGACSYWILESFFWG
jgi:glycerol 2-dehydrogenase (NADP+)